jgi:hypothetical protein
MGEPAPPRNRDQEIPTRSGEEMGQREPLVPQPEPDRKEPERPLPEEETSGETQAGSSAGDQAVTSSERDILARPSSKTRSTQWPAHPLAHERIQLGESLVDWSEPPYMARW